MKKNTRNFQTSKIKTPANYCVTRIITIMNVLMNRFLPDRFIEFHRGRKLHDNGGVG